MCIFTHIHYIQCVRMCRCIHLVLVENLRLLNLVSDRVTRSLGRSPKQPAFAFEEEKRIVNNHLYFMHWEFFSCLVLRRRDIVGYHRHKHNNKKEIP
jgi:hypothetical protein